jgi:ferredoxin
MAEPMPKHPVVFFQGEARWTVDVEEGESLLKAAHACEAPVHTLCNGIGACVQCKVRVERGMDNLSPPNTLERDRLGSIFHLTHERLACQSFVQGPCEVEALPVRLPKKKLGGPPPRRGGETPPRRF